MVTATCAQARLKALFQPLQIGPMRVANRIVMAPMERNFANPDGSVSERTIAHYRARAEGGVGWIDVESTFVHPAGRGRTHQLGIHHDGAIEGFRALAGAVHDAGAKIGIELHHAGRNTSSLITGTQPVAPSPVPCVEAGGEIPHELSGDEIDQVVQCYADAARRAAEAGFDAVELHSAHGYLPLAFLSPLTNQRSDDYGGTPERRAFFAQRVVGAMRSVVPAGVAVGCRFSAQEHLAGGLQLDDTIEYARALERAGVDYLSVSTGVYASFVRIIPPMDFAPGWLLSTAAAVKRAVSVPVIGVSRVVDPLMADAAVSRGDVDLVALGRALLTDPEWPNKARDGRLDEIVWCIGCNQGCEARIRTSAMSRAWSIRRSAVSPGFASSRRQRQKTWWSWAEDRPGWRRPERARSGVTQCAYSNGRCTWAALWPWPPSCPSAPVGALSSSSRNAGCAPPGSTSGSVRRLGVTS